MLSNIPLVGRLFNNDGEVSFATLEDAQHIVERMQSEIQRLHEEAEESRQQRAAELQAQLAELQAQRTALETALASLNKTIEATEAALETALVVSDDAPEVPAAPLGGITATVLAQNDDSTTNAVISVFSKDPTFQAKAKESMESLLKRDKEDDDKLAAGIKLAVDRGVLEAGVVVEPVDQVDVTGKSADEVADYICAACYVTPNGDDGRVVVLQGLSGTGKGTTVSKLLSRFDSCVSWSNGNVFRALTLLALEHCRQSGVDFDEALLTPENLKSWMAKLTFDLFPEGYDIYIEGVDARVSNIATTTLKEPRIGKAIPTVAGYSQGEVVTFAASCIHRMRNDGLTVLIEGRAPTLAYVRSPYRFELVIDDPLLLGARRVAQRLVGLALKALAQLDNAKQKDVNDALYLALSAL